MANAGEIVSYTGAGAGIGTLIGGPIGAGVGAGVGALVGVGKGWYDRNKAGKERRWQENELLRQYQALEALANNQTAGQQDAINKQLGIESKNLASTFATSGGIRTGNYQRKVGELNAQAVTDVANVSRQNALQAKMMEMGYTQQVKNFNLELAKLESAKGAGDAQMAMSAGENIAPFVADLLKNIGGGGGAVNSNPTLSEISPPKVLGNLSPADYGINNPSTDVNQSFDWLRNIGKTKMTGYAGKPYADNPEDYLWGN